MLKLIFSRPMDEPLRLLCLGAHSDDIEIGCGGTILRLAREYPQLEVDWVVMGALGERAEEARKSAEELLAGVERKSITIKNYRDGFFPYRGEEIKNDFEELKGRLSPDLILTHYRQDLHQDHRLMCELTWNTWRDHMILEYEIPKYDGDLGSPNFFVQLDQETCRQKIACILAHFKTQANRHWFTEETFNALLRLRGIESKAPGGYAEGFYCRKASY